MASLSSTKKFELRAEIFNASGHVMLVRDPAGVVNDAKWIMSIRENLLIGYPDIKDAFDLNQDLADLPLIDPLE